MKRLLTIGHSYVVALNRRLAHEMAVAGAGAWDVTAAAPSALPGDLRPITLETMAGERCRTVPLRMHAARSPHLRFYGGLGALLRERWDVIHCWEEPYVAAGWQVARHARGGAPLVFATFQNIRKHYPPPFGWMERATLRKSDGWIAFGRTVHDALGAAPDYARLPSCVISPGVDTMMFAPNAEARARIRAAHGWADDGIPVVGFLGRFVPQKGPGVLAQALARIQRPWRALFVGGGRELAPLQEFAARFPGRVRFATDVTHESVGDQLNAMDILCAPSQTTPAWREQFGRMLIEAMACGVPVMASHSGEIPHVVGDAGILLPEQDVDAWAGAIEALMGDAARRRQLAAAGRARALATFAWPQVAVRHLEFFERVAR